MSATVVATRREELGSSTRSHVLSSVRNDMVLCSGGARGRWRVILFHYRLEREEMSENSFAKAERDEFRGSRDTTFARGDTECSKEPPRSCQTFR